MELGLVKVGDNSMTPTGALYVEKVSDTLHRVKKYYVELMDKSTREISFRGYEVLSARLTRENLPKFVKFPNGELIASHQIARVVVKEVIVDTRKETL